MFFKIIVNRSDCKGWRLWADEDVLAGYQSFLSALGGKSDLVERYPDFNFKVIGVDYDSLSC